jgi:hypothetical protein
MRILHEPLNLLDANDIQQLCADGVSEGTEIELKADLPSKAGPQQDPWYKGDPIGEYARNKIAEEIVAFANTLGGVVCVGINETADHPKRAASPNPLPRVHELARRLRQAVYGVIDPPLAVLEAIGIGLGPADVGVVLLRVPQSRRRPHRHSPTKEVFVRREDETAKVSMREIQELTIQSVAEATRIETTITERRAKFLDDAGEWHRMRSENGMQGGALHMLGVPTAPIDLVRVVGRPHLTGALASVSVSLNGGTRVECTWPHAKYLIWKPGLRSVFAEHVIDGSKIGVPDESARYSLHTSGVCELSYMFKTNRDHPGLFAAWIAGAMGFMLGWLHRVRGEAGVSTEYALATQLTIYDQPVLFAEYGATTFAPSRGARLPKGGHVFPIASIGSTDEFPSHLARFDEDLWNLAGQDTQRWAPPTFSVQL